jgi:uncharacterized protein (TIGR03663 family)
MNKAVFLGLVPLVVLGALLLRLPGLGLRPMHHDEANQALKLGRLLETGEYRYDPADHHGPSLYYLSWILARALGRTTLASLDEADLRLLPALFGAGTVLLLLCFAGAVGRTAALAAGALAAASPAFTYYSRFYIQESIFVFFIAAFALALWKWRNRPSSGWALAAGAGAGLMFATKETSIIIFAALAAAIAGTRVLLGRTPAAPAGKRAAPRRDLALGSVAAAATAALLFSSFFRNPRGILDSLLAFQNYLAKSGDPGFHAHPAGYYIGLLTYSRSGGLVWSESLILALACLGVIAAIRSRQEFRVAAALAALLAAAAFSLIPYKTPWNALPFFLGFVILAGIGTDFLFRSLKRIPAKAVAGVLIGAGLLNLAWQSCQANFRYPADPRNPYVYAQTSPDYQRLVKRVDDITPFLPGAEKALIKVVCGPYETWPLPWSLRRRPNAGYWTDAAAAGIGPGAASGAPPDAPLVIASEDQAAKIGPALQDAYHAEFYGLRPGVLLTLFIANEPWERFLSERRR